MPRPRRARVTPSAPVTTASRRAAAAENAEAIPTSNGTRSSVRKPLTNVSNTTSSVRTNSDSSDACFGLVKNAPKGSQRQGGGRRDESAMMVGGLGEGEVRLRKRAGRRETQDQREANGGRRSNLNGRVTRAVEESVTVGQSEGTINGSRSHQGLAASAGGRITAVGGKGHAVDAPAALDSDPLPKMQTRPDAALGMEQSRRITPSPEKLERLLQQIPSSAQRMRNTPGGDTSILALGNWRRRPKQPSVVRTVTQQPSDLDTEDSFELPASDDFNPDDESTPLKLGTVQQPGKAVGNDQDQAVDVVELATSTSRKRKLSTPSVPVQNNQPGEQILSSSSPQMQRESSSSLPSDPVAVTGQRITLGSGYLDEPDEARLRWKTPQSARARPPEILSDTQASPLSSSHLSQSSSPQRRQPHRSRPLKAAAATKRTARQTKQDKEAKRLTTAELTTLLPQRRNRRRQAPKTDFEIFSSSEQRDASEEEELDEDEDELAPRQRKTKKSRAGPSAKPKIQTPTSAKRKKSRATATSAGRSRLSELKHRYGRNSSDKENQGEGDEEPSEFMQHLASSGESAGDHDTIVVGDGDDGGKRGGGRKGKHRESLELSAAAKKFAEVDEWEMEFESVETGGRSSSPWR
ncbi:MAG: hypothetical protein Q9165_006864 [Trypethelium subeluteriae]